MPQSDAIVNEPIWELLGVHQPEEIVINTDARELTAIARDFAALLGGVAAGQVTTGEISSALEQTRGRLFAVVEAA